MAVRYETRYVDDIDGAALENDEVQSNAFSFDGKDYSIDLSAANAEAFREAISPFLNAATKVAPRSVGPPTRPPPVLPLARPG